MIAREFGISRELAMGSKYENLRTALQAEYDNYLLYDGDSYAGTVYTEPAAGHGPYRRTTGPDLSCGCAEARLGLPQTCRDSNPDVWLRKQHDVNVVQTSDVFLTCCKPNTDAHTDAHSKLAAYAADACLL